MLDVDAIMRPWWDRLCDELGDIALYDAHTHVGADDPDGVKQTPAQLLALLEGASARAVVFPMHEPAGYPPANDRVLEAAADSDGRLVAYCRVDPRAERRRRGAPLPGRRARAGSSCTRGRRSSRCPSPPCAS